MLHFCVCLCVILFLLPLVLLLAHLDALLYTVKLLQQNVIVQSLYVLLAEGKHKNINVFFCSTKFPYAIDLNNPCGVL